MTCLIPFLWASSPIVLKGPLKHVTSTHALVTDPLCPHVQIIVGNRSYIRNSPKEILFLKAHISLYIKYVSVTYILKSTELTLNFGSLFRRDIGEIFRFHYKN